MGSIKPNHTAGDEGESSEESVGHEWMQLLSKNKDVYALKPWKEVSTANKSNLSLALREIMRQAWRKYNGILINFFISS